MSDLIEMPELALDRHMRHFAPHPDMVAWRIECVTMGRTFSVTENGETRYIRRDASLVDLEEAVNHRSGLYRLTQTDGEGNDLSGTVAYVEVHGRNLGSEQQIYGVENAMTLCREMAEANQNKDRMLADLMKTLMHTHVQLQTGAATLLEVANNTIRVANGIEALERVPPVDVDEIAERVADVMDEREPPVEEKSHWFVQLSEGPIGQAALGILTGFAQSVAQAQLHKRRKPNPDK